MTETFDTHGPGVEPTTSFSKPNGFCRFAVVEKKNQQNEMKNLQEKLFLLLLVCKRKQNQSPTSFLVFQTFLVPLFLTVIKNVAPLLLCYRGNYFLPQ